MNFCEKCGQKLNPGTEYCPKCGVKIKSAPTATPTPTRTAPETPPADHSELGDAFKKLGKELGKEGKAFAGKTKDYMETTGIPFIQKNKKIILGVVAAIVALIIIIVAVSAIVSAVSPAECDYCGDLIKGKKHTIKFQGEKGVFCSDCAEIVEGLKGFAGLFS